MRTIPLFIALCISILTLSACPGSGTDIPDDPFEPNDDSANATSTLANTSYDGRLRNEDWFRIEVTAGFERVVASLTFTHADGNIDLELIDASGNVLATSDSTTDNERIDFTVSSSGVYFLRLFSDSYTGNSYSLSWLLDDVFEPNDSIMEATPATTNTSYTGVQFDDDWFQISVAAGFERVTANLAFAHADGDINLELVDASGNVLATSESTSDNEQIVFTVSTAGTYYLRVFDAGSGSGNTYALSWNGSQPLLIDDPYEENDTLAAATALPEKTQISGVQLDDDWYHIAVQPGFERIVADLTFTHANGDLDLALYDSSETRIGPPSNSSTDNERIAVDAMTGGDYYLRVYNFAGASTANSYTLTWHAPADDLYEPNNSLPTAADLPENTGISAIQLDEDWYRIDVSPGSLHLVIDLTFVHASGDLDIVLKNSAGAFRASGESLDDNEHIDITVTAGGTYYLQIYDGTNVGGSTGNTYDLIWSSSP